MANNPGETPSDDFFEQILGFPNYGGGVEANFAGNEAATSAMMLQLGSGDGSDHLGGVCGGIGVGLGGAYGVGSGGSGFPLGLSLEQGKGGGFMKMDDASGSGKRFHRDDIVDSRTCSSVKAGFHGQPMINTVPALPHPPVIRPRVRARRGQATDPHSIAERLRRERIAERIRALQELVPRVNKTDRAVMLDEIVDYVKFLRLQVKVLSMSRLGGAGAVAPLVTDVPVSSVEVIKRTRFATTLLSIVLISFYALILKEGGDDSGRAQPAWEKWSNDGTEQQVAKLMEENVGAAMQFLQSKALCIMPTSLASAIYHTQPPDTAMKPDSCPSS